LDLRTRSRREGRDRRRGRSPSIQQVRLRGRRKLAAPCREQVELRSGVTGELGPPHRQPSFDDSITQNLGITCR
jgi:hypothetical protein